MPSWIQRASLLLLFLLSFDTSSLVFGAPQPPTRLARQLKPLGAETNAKRFAMGLPPLPPMRRGSGTDTARRSTSSDTQVVTKKIKVTGVDQIPLGYLQLTGFHDRYTVGSAASASQFQTTLSTTGGTLQANFFDLNAPSTSPYLAGLIEPGVELTSGTSDVGVLGGANPPTSQGSTPQSSGTTSIVGDEYETAIWNVSPSSDLTLSWVNHNGVSSPIYIFWYPFGRIIYLSPNSMFSGATPVTLSLE